MWGCSANLLQGLYSTMTAMLTESSIDIIVNTTSAAKNIDNTTPGQSDLTEEEEKNWNLSGLNTATNLFVCSKKLGATAGRVSINLSDRLTQLRESLSSQIPAWSTQHTLIHEYHRQMQPHAEFGPILGHWPTLTKYPSIIPNLVRVAAAVPAPPAATAAVTTPFVSYI